MPSNAVVVLTLEGKEQVNVGFEIGSEVAVIVINIESETEPSVNFNFAIPDVLKVTGKGVLMDEVVILAPVNDQVTVVVGEMFVTY